MSGLATSPQLGQRTAISGLLSFKEAGQVKTVPGGRADPGTVPNRRRHTSMLGHRKNASVTGPPRPSMTESSPPDWAGLVQRPGAQLLATGAVY